MGFSPTISVSILYAPWVDWRHENAKEQYEQLQQSDYIDAVEMHAAEKSPIWENERQCWLNGADMDSTHHINIQGDVVLCEGFGEAAWNALSDVPNRPVSFYGTRQTLREAFEDGQRWHRWNGGLWGQAPCLPSMWLEEMVEWGDYYAKDEWGSSDRRYTAWAQLALDVDTWVTTPQLAEHIGDGDSARGSIPPSDWTAAVFVDDTDLDARDIDWSYAYSEVPYENDVLEVNRDSDRWRIDRLAEDGYVQEVQS